LKFRGTFPLIYIRAVDLLLNMRPHDNSYLAGTKPSRRHLLRAGVSLGIASMSVIGDGLIDDSLATAGDELWRFETIDSVQSSPTIIEETVLIGSGYVSNPTDTHLYALDSDTGREKWQYDSGDPVHSSPAVVNDIVFAGNTDGTVFALDFETGTKKWSFDTSFGIKSSPSIEDETLIIGSLDGNVYALDTETGQKKWEFLAGDRRPLHVYSSPTIIDGTVYIGSGSSIRSRQPSDVYAIDIDSGNKRWDYRAESTIESSPTVWDETVYVGSGDTFVHALDANNGDAKWKYRTNGRVRSSATVADNTVFIGSDDNYLHAIHAETGKERWSFETNDAVRSSPTVVAETVIVGSDDGHIYALDIDSGTLRWQFQTNSWIRSSPTVVNGTVFIGSGDGYVYAIDSNNEESSRGSRVRLQTLGHHHQSMNQQPTNAVFEVMIRDISTPIEAGDEITIDVEIQNSGGKAGTQSISVAIDNIGTDSRMISLDPNESTLATFEIATNSEDSGEYSITTSSEDDSATNNIMILTGATFDVREINLEEQKIESGGEFHISALIVNSGDASGDQAVDLYLNNQKIQSRDISLDSGESIDISFNEVDTRNLSPGNEYRYSIRTEDAARSGTLEILSASTPTTTSTSTSTTRSDQTPDNATNENDQTLTSTPAPTPSDTTSENGTLDSILLLLLGSGFTITLYGLFYHLYDRVLSGNSNTSE